MADSNETNGETRRLPEKIEQLDKDPNVKSSIFEICITDKEGDNAKIIITTYTLKKRGPDDIVYKNNEYLRKLLPRGFSVVTIEKNGEQETSFISGFMKFSGMEDDDISIDPEKANLFYRSGKFSDATHFMVTEKSNGENAKWTIRKLHDTYWVFAGSKNTCRVFPLDSDPREWYPIRSNVDYGNLIAYEVHKIIKELESSEKLDKFVKTVIDNSYIIMGELNNPYSEHVFPINELEIEHVALIGADNVEVNPVDAFRIFDEFGLYAVYNKLHSIEDIEEVTKSISTDTTNEGAVLYLMKQDDESHVYDVLALIKHKTDYYVLARRIRQNFWQLLVTPLEEFQNLDKKTIVDVAEKCQRILCDKIRQLNFLPNFKKNEEQWVDIGRRFIIWWTNNFVKDSCDKPKCLKMARSKFGTVYNNFMKDIEKSTTFLPFENNIRQSETITVLRGPSGSGKTYQAKKMAEDGAVIACADDFFANKGAFDHKKLQDAHRDCMKRTMMALHAGKSVIVANTNINLWEMKSYVNIATLFGVEIKIVDIDIIDTQDHGKIIPWKAGERRQSVKEIAEFLNKRTQNRDDWRPEIPTQYISNQLNNFKKCDSIADIISAQTPRFAKNNTRMGVYGGAYVGFSHPRLIQIVWNSIHELEIIEPNIFEYFCNAFIRDGFSKHITLAVWKNLPNINQGEFMNCFMDLTIDDFKFVGIGKVKDNDNFAYYIIVTSEKVYNIYELYGLKEHIRDLHITIGFKHSDIHGVPKNIETQII